MKSFKDYEELAASYNTIRETNKGITFSTKTFFGKISFIKINVNYTSLWVKYGLAIKVDRGQYRFPDEPVLWSKLKYAYEEMHKLQRESKQKYRHLNKQVCTKINSKEADVNNVNIKDLIDLYNIDSDEIARYLVSTGNYRISKRVEEWNAVL